MGYLQTDEVLQYRNFLKWLFLTFNENETDFRRKLVSDVKPGNRVLVTGCGHGEDVPAIFDAGASEVECLDISETMIGAAKENLAGRNVKFHVADACSLSFADASFDLAFHFGGINLYSDVRKGIAEMARVVKDGGRVVFGDEGVAPWLRNTDYGKMAINNNALWSSDAPLGLLPFSATDVSVKWVLGNCFYLVSFTVHRGGPYVNPDVKHAGRRGGSMRTRYYGQLEGVTEETKRRVLESAARENISVHDWLERKLRS